CEVDGRRDAQENNLATLQTLHCSIEDSIVVCTGERPRAHLQAVVDRGVQEIDGVFRIDIGSQLSSTLYLPGTCGGGRCHTMPSAQGGADDAREFLKKGW